ncbi:MAG: hypothetical protein IPM54_25145 [Polyangiaceae bacterium]|nr:hypothetical protein [Polyangiaceae bacterium]
MHRYDDDGNSEALATVEAIEAVPEHFVSIELLAPRLGYNHKRGAVAAFKRLVEIGKIRANEFRRELGKTSPVGGRPENVIWLSPTAAIELAIAAGTPEADEWRREQMAKLVKPAPGNDSKAMLAKSQQMLDEALALHQDIARQLELDKRVRQLEQRRERKPRTTLSTGAIDGASLEASLKALLDQTGHDAGITIPDIARALEFELDDGLSKRLGILLARAGWVPTHRVRVNGTQQRVYRPGIDGEQVIDEMEGARVDASRGHHGAGGDGREPSPRAIRRHAAQAWTRAAQPPRQDVRRASARMHSEPQRRRTLVHRARRIGPLQPLHAHTPQDARHHGHVIHRPTRVVVTFRDSRKLTKHHLRNQADSCPCFVGAHSRDERPGISSKLRIRRV